MENTELDLLNTVKQFVEEHNTMLVSNKKGELVVPHVYKHFTPTAINQRNDGGVYPAYIVRFGNSEVNAEQQFEDECAIRIVAVSTNENHEAGMDQAMKMIRQMKEALQSVGFIGPFDQVGKMKMTVPEEQEFPQWLAVLDVSFNIPAIQTNYI